MSHLLDNTLDLDEVEGLARIGGTSGVGSGSSRSSRNSSYFDQVIAQVCEPKNRKKGILFGFLGALFLLIVAANAGSGGDASAGSHGGSEAKPIGENIQWLDPEPVVSVGDSAGEVVVVDALPNANNDQQPVVDNPVAVTDGSGDKATPEGGEEVIKIDEPAEQSKEEPAVTPVPDVTDPPVPDATDPPVPDATDPPVPDATDPPAPEETKTEETKTEETAAPKSDSKIPLSEPDKESGPVPDDKRAELAEKYGSWHFWDGDEDVRPKEDFISQYPNRDIPGDKFPDTAWQTDAVYVNHFLNDAGKLIDRAMEAIFTEYGHGKPLPPEGMAERMKMFHWEKIDLSTETEPPPEFRHRGARDIGGWTSKRSFDGLIRRLLHAMITQDTFTVVLAGHSAAQGQGNHFRQSYAMQFHRLMKPIFARLGVKLITHNMAQGGMGTLQGGMGARHIYGQEIDLFLWDSGMTENGAPHHIDLVLRQVMMSGNRVPVMWGGPFELLQLFHEEADADVGEWGSGYAGLPETKDEVQAETLPWAARKMKCSSERQDLCNENRYSSVCWINRTDGIRPEQGQRARPRGQVKWHPGWRPHQLMGRVLSFSVLEALEVAVNKWMEGTMTGQPLDDDFWHVTEYYENIRSKVMNMNQTLGRCHEIANNDELPLRMCNTPMNGRTQYTPRADYEGASLNGIVKVAPNGYSPKNTLKLLYEGPDMHNPAFDVPEGSIDVLSIVMGRRRHRHRHRRLSKHHQPHKQAALPAISQMDVTQKEEEQPRSAHSLRRQLDEEISPGEGWDVSMEPQGICDGKYDSVCAHDTHEECFLMGHHDQRGAVVGCEWSGWLVMTLKALKEGLIVVKLQTWHVAAENPKARNWRSVNAKRRLGEGQALNVTKEDDVEYYMGDLAYPEIETMPSNSRRRKLMRSYSTPELPDTFAFDYAINGKITTLNNTEFMDKKKQLQRVVETLTILDDPEFTKEEQDVEVAIRLRGVATSMFFGVSHIYWA